MKANYKGVDFEVESKEDLKMLFDSVGKNNFEIIEPEKSVPVQSSKRQNNKHRVWSSEDDKFLTENINRLGVRVVSKTLGRTMGAVKVRLHTLKYANQQPKPRGRPPKVGRGNGRRLNKRAEVAKLFAQGKTYDEIIKATGYNKRQLYDIAYVLRKRGMLPQSTHPLALAKRNKESILTATFSMVSKDKMDVARQMVSSCAKSKSRITASDCATFLGLNVSESKAFMLDAFQQQKKLGYKVVIEGDKLVFQ